MTAPHSGGTAPDPGPVDVLVVGAGAVGLASAWRCAQAGLEVVVVDPQPGRGASWAAAGMLAPATEAHFGEEALAALTLESSRRWPQFAADLADASGVDLGYRRTGTLSVARDADDLAVLERVAEFQRGLGLDVERLRSRECRALEPLLAPSIRGGVLASGDHQVDNRALVTALLAAVERAGVVVHREAVTSVAVDGGAVRGVVGETGTRLSAPTVVLAAGWSTGRIDVPASALPRVRPVKGQLLHLRATAAHAAVPQRNVRGLDVYLVPRADGRLVVGATMEEVGEDLRVTAGAVHELLRAARELVPGVDELDLVECVAGLRPGSPDNLPLLGPTDVDGLLLATGHHRNGVLLTPVTAAAIADLASGGDPGELVAPFSPARGSAA